jgi:hypothetical protein
MQSLFTFKSAHFFFFMHVVYLRKYSFKLCSCILLNYRFQNLCAELIPKKIANGYQNV